MNCKLISYLRISALGLAFLIVLTGFLLTEDPDQPEGIPTGINPGRVVWAWNPDATNENCLQPLITATGTGNLKT